MNVKRVLTTVVGLPIVTLIMIYANKYIIDVILTIVALIAMNEYVKCCSSKDAKIIKWISYVSVLFIAFVHIIPAAVFNSLILIGIPLLIMILFAHVIITDMKITYTDVAYTLLGIVYVVGSILFMALVYGLEGNISGKILIWYVLFSAWGTDIFAYSIGRRIGKTKFSKVSPNKSIEGCVAGTVSAAIVCLIYAYAINTFLACSVSYLTVAIIAVVLSIAGQIGDFSASVIKRYFGVKDYSNLFPGHGGMLDRIDSLMFIAPVAYVIFAVLMLI